MIDPIQILREKFDAMVRAKRGRHPVEGLSATLEFSAACQELLPALLALPYHLPASALIAVEGFAASDQLPIAAAYPTEGGEWRAVRGAVACGVYRDYEAATLPDYHAAVEKLSEWGCTRIKRRFEDELPETVEGGDSA